MITSHRMLIDANSHSSGDSSHHPATRSRCLCSSRRYLPNSVLGKSLPWFSQSCWKFPNRISSSKHCIQRRYESTEIINFQWTGHVPNRISFTFLGSCSPRIETIGQNYRSWTQMQEAIAINLFFFQKEHELTSIKFTHTYKVQQIDSARVCFHCLRFKIKFFHKSSEFFQ